MKVFTYSTAYNGSRYNNSFSVRVSHTINGVVLYKGIFTVKARRVKDFYPAVFKFLIERGLLDQSDVAGETFTITNVPI